jgi:histidyl-tRNA synthetase
VGIKINSRKVMASILAAQGVSNEQFAPVCVIIDKLDKIGADEVAAELVGIGVPEKTARAIIATMSAKSVDELRALAEGADQEGLVELEEVFSQAEAYGFREFLLFDASVVRGLAYYTGIVFECFDRSGELRAICGGGRYDKLLTLYGSQQEIPCVGFGFGDCVIMELLEMKGLIPNMQQQVDYVVAAYDKSMLCNAMSVAARLRAAGAVVDMQMEPKKKVGQTFDYANRIGARCLAFVGPGEWVKGEVRVKDLRMEDKDANQKDVPLDSLANWRAIF